MRIDPVELTTRVCELFTARGASGHNAAAVAAHLVESEQLHLPSHGMIRVRQYLNEIENGLLDAAAVPVSTADSETVHRVDGRLGFGQVAGLSAVEIARDVAERYGMAFVSVRNVQHTGRLGAYTEPLAAAGMVAMAFGAGAPRFHRVVPFGGKDGRMSTNPIAWAAPMPDGVMSADFSTSAVPEGKIRVLQAAGKPAPAGTICDADGLPTTDPALFYGQPGGSPAPGFLLPLGGAEFGHKGYALGLLSECMATILSGDRTDVAAGRANNLAVLAVRGDGQLPDRVGALADHVRSARPVDPARPVMIPGQPERTGLSPDGPLELPDHLWASLSEDFAAS